MPCCSPERRPPRLLSFQAHYLSSNSSDQPVALAVDKAGNSFVVSVVVTGSGGYRLRATKADSQGHVVASFDFGSTTRDQVSSAVINSQGNLIVVGTTYSSSFPVTAPPVTPVVPSSNGSAAFVTILDPGLTHIVASTLLGGSMRPFGAGTQGGGVAVDSSGNVYVSGSTGASDFPVTLGAYSTNPPWHDNTVGQNYAFVAKFSPDLQHILYATYFGGDAPSCVGGSACIAAVGQTYAASVAVDSTGEVVIAGITSALNLPVTPGAYATHCGCSQWTQPGFAAKFSASGATLLWSTYLPVTTQMANLPVIQPTAVAFDSAPDVVVAGETTNGLPTTPGAVQPTYPLGPVNSGPPNAGFVVKLDHLGQRLIFATYLGASTHYGAALNAMAIDSGDHIWLAGNSDPAALPASTTLGPDYIAELAADGSSVLQLYGAPAGSAGQALALLPSGGIAALGSGSSRLLSSTASGPSLVGITNAAGTDVRGVIARGEIVSLYGYNLGPSTPLTAVVTNDVVSSSLGGYQVLFNGIPAPMLYAGTSQINAIVPQRNQRPGRGDGESDHAGRHGGHGTFRYGRPA